MPRWNPNAPVADQIQDLTRQLFIHHRTSKGVRPAVDDEEKESMLQTHRRRVRRSTEPSGPRPIYTWAFESSKAVGGVKTNYATDLYADGTLKCNCPGWIYKRKDARGCKHTDQIQHEVPTVLQLWKDGASLPVFKEEAKVGFTDVKPKSSRKKKATKKQTEDDGSRRYGRVIEV